MYNAYVCRTEEVVMSRPIIGNEESVFATWHCRLLAGA